MYDIMRGKKVLYVGPANLLEALSQRKDLGLEEKGFYQLSLARDHSKRYDVMNNFIKTVDSNYWDLILVTGSLYGRTIIGRVKEAGGRAFDIGQGIFFTPNNIFQTAARAIENKTYYELVDSSQEKQDGRRKRKG
jgi:hypothetical protein